MKREEELKQALQDLCDAWEVEGTGKGGGRFNGNITNAYKAARSALRAHEKGGDLIEENRRLREALELCMVGGNHLANVLIGNVGAGFAERFPPDTDHESALRSLCATDNYEVWCCWSAIMRARAALTHEHNDTSSSPVPDKGTVVQGGAVSVKTLAPVDVYKVLKKWSDNGALDADHLSAISREVAALLSTPIAWESMTSGYTKFVSDERYRKFSSEVRAWYKPYRCSSCADPNPEVTLDDLATAGAIESISFSASENSQGTVTVHQPKPEAEPVAWTSPAQLDGLKKYPGHILSMWAKGLLAPDEEIPLYAHPPRPEATEGVRDGQIYARASRNNVPDDVVQASLEKARKALEATEGGAHEKGWQPIETAPKGLPSEDVGCRYESEWFLGRVSPRYREGRPPFIVICRRGWPHEDSWKCAGEAHYVPNFFDAWSPLRAALNAKPEQTDGGGE